MTALHLIIEDSIGEDEASFKRHSTFTVRHYSKQSALVSFGNLNSIWKYD